MASERKGKQVEQRRGVKLAEVEQRRERALALRVKGWALRAIASELGISLGQAHADVEAVLERTRKSAYENAERHLQVSLERIDVAIKGIMPKVEAGDLRACEVLTSLEERRAKFLGLDAATRYEHSGPAGAPITVDARSALLEKLASLVAGTAAGGGPSTVPPQPE